MNEIDFTTVLPVKDFMKHSPELRVVEGDYKGKDDIWYCGKCHKPKQKKIDTEWMKTTVWILCDCAAKELEKRKKADEYEEEMRRIRILKDSSMMSDKYRTASFSSYYVREENRRACTVAKKYVRDFKIMRKDGHPKTGEKNVGILFYGATGTGKSYTAACIANALMEQKVPVIMTSFVKILQDIKNVEDETIYIKHLNSCELLIIDDLGAERDTDYALEKVYNVVDSRVRVNKPMIVTTNLTFQDMMQTMDIRYKRIYDRIFESCIPIEIPGNSFRIIKAAQRQKRLENYFDE